MVSIQKFRIIVLVSNRIKYWSNYSIRLEISNIRTALILCKTANLLPEHTQNSHLQMSTMYMQR